MTQREALLAWYDSGAENRDAFIALIDAAQAQAAAKPVGYTNEYGMAYAVKWSGALPPRITLYATPPAHTGAMRIALEALRELADCGAEAWSAERPCVKDGYAAIAALEKEVK